MNVIDTLLRAQLTVMALPDPAPIQPPGTAELTSIMGWAKWIALAVCILGLIAAGAVDEQHRGARRAVSRPLREMQPAAAGGREPTLRRIGRRDAPRLGAGEDIEAGKARQSKERRHDGSVRMRPHITRRRTRRFPHRLRPSRSSSSRSTAFFAASPCGFSVSDCFSTRRACGLRSSFSRVKPSPVIAAKWRGSSFSV